MKIFFIKFAIFLAMLITFGLIAFGIHAVAEDEKEKEPVDSRPVVSIESLVPINHQVEITSFGELQPLESTVLAAQVSGEVLSWNPNFVAGGVVQRGDILFTIEADAYEANVLQAEAQISLAEATLIEELARQKVAEREARNLPKNQVSDLYLRKPQVLSAQAQLKSAQATLRIAKRDLEKTRVRAPYDALVVSRDIGSGQFVTAGMRVAEINNVETAEIIVPIAGFDTQFLPANILNNPAMVKTRGNKSISRVATVNRNLGIVDQTTRMQHLVLRVEDPYGLVNGEPTIKFGTYVEVAFSGMELQNVFKIPQTLVTNRRIWLASDDNILEAHDVEVIREEGSYFYISSGLQAQDRLVLTLPEYPQNGMEVKIKESPSAQLNTVTANNNSGL
jgi:RND family efflux transporter MFP subunit